MKITVEQYGETITYDLGTDEVYIGDLHNIWMRLLVSLSYSSKLVNDFYEGVDSI